MKNKDSSANTKNSDQKKCNDDSEGDVTTAVTDEEKCTTEDLKSKIMDFYGEGDLDKTNDATKNKPDDDPKHSPRPIENSLRYALYEKVVFADGYSSDDDDECDVDFIPSKEEEEEDDNLERLEEEGIIGMNEDQYAEFQKFQLKYKRGYYHDRVLNYETYLKIKKAIAPCFEREQLLMLLHEFSTQKCENFHSVMSTLAPKHLFLGGSITLQTRVCIAVGLLTLGHFDYWSAVYCMFGLSMDSTMSSFLKSKDKKRSKKKETQATAEFKKRRNREKTKKDTLQIKCDLKSRRNKAIYKSFIAMEKESVVTVKEEEDSTLNRRSKSKYCPFYPMCDNRVPHKTSAHRTCLLTLPEDESKHAEVKWAREAIRNRNNRLKAEGKPLLTKLCKSWGSGRMMRLLGDGPWFDQNTSNEK